MKKTSLLFALLFSVSIIAQNKEKIKGSRNVIIKETPIHNLSHLEIEDNLEVTLVKGSNSGVKIESDDNLHEFIVVETFGNKIRLHTTKNITSFKKLEVVLTYNDSLHTITTRHQSELKSYQELKLKNITITLFDYSKAFLNIKADHFKLISADKSKVELNAKAENILIQTRNSSNVKALTNAKNLDFLIVDKSKAVIEGDANKSNIKLSGDASLIAKNIVSNDTNLFAENNTYCEIFSKDDFVLKAKNNAEIHLYGDPKITIDEFKDRAKLLKENR